MRCDVDATWLQLSATWLQLRARLELVKLQIQVARKLQIDTLRTLKPLRSAVRNSSRFNKLQRINNMR